MVSLTNECFCSSIPFCFGKTQCSCKVCSVRKASRSSTTNDPSSTVETQMLPLYHPSSFDYGSNPTSSSVVVQQGVVCTGSFSQTRPCISHSVYGLSTHVRFYPQNLALTACILRPSILKQCRITKPMCLDFPSNLMRRIKIHNSIQG